MANKVQKVDEKAELPAAMLETLASDAGLGLDGAKADDFAIPFLNIIQSLSPQRMKSDPKYIPGAEEGMIFNTVTNQLFTGAEVVPVHFEKMYNEWKPRNSGGGLVALNTDRQLAYSNLREGNLIVDTANHYVLFKDEDGAWRPAVISCTSTKLKVSRAWNSRMSMVTAVKKDGTKFNPPTFSRWYMFTTNTQKNDKGTFYVPVFLDGGWVDAETYKAAKLFRDSILAGKVEVRHDQSGSSDETSEF